MGFNEIERQRNEYARNRENQGRWANAYARFRSLGQGPYEFEERAPFGLTFVEVPFVAIGHQIDLDEVEAIVTTPVANGDTPPMPQVTGFVTEWEIDDRGFYIGAWCAVVVAFPAEIPVDAELEIQHYFTFSANAIKDIPTEGAD